MKGLDMKEFFEDLKPALDEFATIFLFFTPCICKNEKKISKVISKK